MVNNRHRFQRAGYPPQRVRARPAESNAGERKPLSDYCGRGPRVMWRVSSLLVLVFSWCVLPPFSYFRQVRQKIKGRCSTL